MHVVAILDSGITKVGLQGQESNMNDQINPSRLGHHRAPVAGQSLLRGPFMLSELPPVEHVVRDISHRTSGIYHQGIDLQAGNREETIRMIRERPGDKK
jgi:hypothetical protein